MHPDLIDTPDQIINESLEVASKRRLPFHPRLDHFKERAYHRLYDFIRHDRAPVAAPAEDHSVFYY